MRVKKYLKLWMKNLPILWMDTQKLIERSTEDNELGKDQKRLRIGISYTNAENQRHR